MKLFRSILFWTHLTAGVLASVVILVMSFTGVVLALKPQIQNWIERDVRYVTPQELAAAQRAPAADRGERRRSRTRRPSRSPSPAIRRLAATVNLGREGNVYVNPYTGADSRQRFGADEPVLSVDDELAPVHGRDRRVPGDGPIGHRDQQPRVPAARRSPACIIWWPKQFTLQHLKPIVWFRRTSTGRARDFNWHNTIGFWCLIPIVIMTVSGAVISYPWASNLVYRLTGIAGAGRSRRRSRRTRQCRAGRGRTRQRGCGSGGRRRWPGAAERGSGAVLRGGRSRRRIGAAAEPSGPRGVAANRAASRAGPRRDAGRQQRRR